MAQHYSPTKFEHPKPKVRARKLIWLLIVAFLVLAAGGYYGYWTTRQKPEQLSNKNLATSQAANGSTENNTNIQQLADVTELDLNRWSTFTTDFSAGNFTFRQPVGYLVSASSDKQKNMSTVSILDQQGREIKMSLDKNQLGLSATDYYQRKNKVELASLETQAPIVISGLEAMKYSGVKLPLGQTAVVLFSFMEEGANYVLALEDIGEIHQTDGIFETILKTWQLVKQPQTYNNWSSYNRPTYQYSLRHPQDWQIKEMGNNPKLRFLDRVNFDYASGQLVKTALAVVVFDAKDLSLEEWIKQERQDPSSYFLWNRLVLADQAILGDIISIRYVDSQGGGNSMAAVFAKRFNRIYAVYLNLDCDLDKKLEIYNDVVRSFEFQVTAPLSGTNTNQSAAPTQTTADLTGQKQPVVVFGTEKIIAAGDPKVTEDDLRQYEVLAINLETGEQKVLFSKKEILQQRFGPPEVTPYGQSRLLLKDFSASPVKVSIINLAGREVENSNFPKISGVVFSPDEKKVAYVDANEDLDNQHGQYKFSVKTLGDGLVTKFTTTGFTNTGYLAPAAWSADGVFIYLTAVTNSEAIKSGLWRADTTDVSVIPIPIVAQLKLEQLQLVADKNWALGVNFQFISLAAGPEPPSALEQIYLADKTNYTVLQSSEGVYLHPQLSADGKTLAYEYLAKGNKEIKLLDLGIKSLDKNVRLAGDVLVWTKDGRRLLYQTNTQLRAYNPATQEDKVLFTGSSLRADSPETAYFRFIGAFEK